MYCWAHARRKLFDLTHHNVAPIAEEGLKQIAALYRIEKQARGTSAEERLALRQAKSAPKIAGFKTWLDQVWILTNKAHALMFLGRVAESSQIHSAQKGQFLGDATWDEVILEDFLYFSKVGLEHARIDAMLAGAVSENEDDRPNEQVSEIINPNEFCEAADIRAYVE